MNDEYRNSDYLARHPEMLEELQDVSTNNGSKEQAFHPSDLVWVVDESLEEKSQAIVEGSYFDLYGGREPRLKTTYTLYVKGGGSKCAWYDEHQMELIERNRPDILETWKAEEATDRQQKSNLDWIFSHGPEVYEQGYGPSLQALADCLNLGNLWGSKGEGIAYYVNANYIRQLSGAWLQTNDKEGWLSFCAEVKQQIGQEMQ